MNKLRLYNGVMGVLHLVQGIIMLALSTDFSLPINTNFLQFNVATQSLQPVADKLADLPVAALVAGFLFMSSAAHFLLIIPGLYEKYIANLKKGINYARWIEYTFSSSLMIVLVAMLTGVYDLGTIIAIFSLNAIMILCGLIMEIVNQKVKPTDWSAFILGCFAGAIPWVIIAINLFGAGEGEYKTPTFVYWIFFSIFLFFNSFAANMYLQYKKVGKWQDYTFGEKMYVLLSLLAKSALAWQIFAGTLRPV